MFRGANCSGQPQSAVDLEWEAPTNCPQSLDVQDQLRSILGELADVPQTNPLHVKGTVESVTAHYRLTLQIERHGTHGTRVIESDDCKSLGKAAAVVLGLLIRREKDLGRELSPGEMSGFAEQPPAPPARPEARLPPPPGQKAEPIAPRAVESAREGRIMLVLPTASADLWTLPSTSYGGGAGVGVAHRGWRSSVTGNLWTNQVNTTSDINAYRTEFKRRSLQATGCRDFSNRAVCGWSVLVSRARQGDSQRF